MWRAVLRKTGQTFSRWGQHAQNHVGILPVGAVETRYPRARGCCRSWPTYKKKNNYCNFRSFPQQQCCIPLQLLEAKTCSSIVPFGCLSFQDFVCSCVHPLLMDFQDENLSLGLFVEYQQHLEKKKRKTVRRTLAIIVQWESLTIVPFVEQMLNSVDIIIDIVVFVYDIEIFSEIKSIL
jgi:hypothetical protein